MTKQALRAVCREAARRMTPEARAAASADIRNRVLSLTEYQQAKTIFVFVSLPAEPDTLPLLQNALGAGKRVCVPRCGEKPRMDAAPIAGLADLKPGYLGIGEPDKNVPPVAPEDIDLALIPCVAAGPGGSRLGHGAGYYDAFLAGRAMTKICLCFDGLLREDIPMDENDVRMDAVVTESRIIPGRENAP